MLCGARVYCGDAFVKTDMLIEDGMIKKMSQSMEKDKDAVVFDFKDKFILRVSLMFTFI
jgi:dihydroorotase-like cyclic amidohydrolase